MPSSGDPFEPPPTLQERRRATGALGEQAAAEHLGRRGLQVLARNYRCATGEIDLIARGRGVIVFAEVKTTRAASRERRDEALLAALERVHTLQRRRIRGAAVEWLRTQPPPVRAGCELRFDAVAVVLDPLGRVAALEHLEGAF